MTLKSISVLHIIDTRQVHSYVMSLLFQIFEKKSFVCYRTDDLKVGNLIGEDKYGNKYFQNDAYFVGKASMSLRGHLYIT